MKLRYRQMNVSIVGLSMISPQIRSMKYFSFSCANLWIKSCTFPVSFHIIFVRFQVSERYPDRSSGTYVPIVHCMMSICVPSIAMADCG